MVNGRVEKKGFETLGESGLRGPFENDSPVLFWPSVAFPLGASLKTDLREANIMERHIESETCMRGVRWLANVTYNSDEGRHGVSYSFCRPEELTDLIEAAQERDRILEVEISIIEDVN